jgi:hypothetical protein
MKIDKRYYILLVLLPALLLISACSTTVGTGTGGSSISVLQLLQNSAQAMKNLKSAHIVTQTNGMVQTFGTTATPTAGTPTPTTSASPVTFNVTGSGDEALPSQEALQISVNQGTNGQATNLAEIVQGDKVYIQNAKGQWYVLDKSTFDGYTANPFSGVNGLDPSNLLGLIQDTKITDHGDQSLNGQNLRHVTITFDKAAFQKILQNDPQLANAIGQQNINTILNSTNTLTANLDLWIDETNFYVHRTELKFNLNEDVSSLSQSLTPVAVFPLPAGVITNFDSTLDLSNFNAPVTITPPTGAIPTDNPLTIFS